VAEKVLKVTERILQEASQLQHKVVRSTSQEVRPESQVVKLCYIH